MPNRLHCNPDFTEIQVHPELQNNTERALVACRLWTHIGFIGATALAVGLLQLLDGEGKWLWALALALLGGVLAAASWRRALTILEHADWASTVATDAPSESTSRASFKETGRGAIALLSPIPPRSNRRHDDELRHPTPE
jgi:hypothetical protein